MAKRVTGLGRGLEALLPADGLSSHLQQMKKDSLANQGTADIGNNENGAEGERSPAFQTAQKVAGTQIQELPLAAILVSGDQPRKHFDELTISELAQSIFEHGLLQPILVMPLKKEESANSGTKYRIIAGERRFRACQVLKWQRIPAIVKSVSEVEQFELALIENIQREDLTPIDEALAYRHLLSVSGVSQQEVAKRLGKGRSALANSLRLLQLPPMVQQGLSQSIIRSGHAKALLMLKDVNILLEAYRLCIEESWSVRQTERYCQEVNNPEVQNTIQETPDSPDTDPGNSAPSEPETEFSDPVAKLPQDSPQNNPESEKPEPSLQPLPTKYWEKSDQRPRKETREEPEEPEEEELEELGELGDLEELLEELEELNGPELDEQEPVAVATASAILPKPAPETVRSDRQSLKTDAETNTETNKVPEYWGVRGMLFREEELEDHLAKALHLGLRLRLEGNLNDSQTKDTTADTARGGTGHGAAARPRKALLQIEFETSEQWESWLNKLGLDRILAEDTGRENPNATDSESDNFEGKTLFSK
ncbi:ParB/RepB/Spo0J family partition protein [Candidatus Haliotispira prima]|uniref:ParB/RepB/Spo0J family partition protein n=1 Tax=Candidatus Haliotispira prima TaxID=3034016 RepID=A0ABY8MJ85_9SPIO|nr:ParB/RepB/Spo0J family partition protein [Candidatus Haliotispira prima]